MNLYFLGKEIYLDDMDTCFIEGKAISSSIPSLKTRSIDGRPRGMVEKRDSVAQMTLKAFNSILHGYLLL